MLPQPQVPVDMYSGHDWLPVCPFVDVPTAAAVGKLTLSSGHAVQPVAPVVTDAALYWFALQGEQAAVSDVVYVPDAQMVWNVAAAAE